MHIIYRTYLLYTVHMMYSVRTYKAITFVVERFYYNRDGEL